MKENVRLAGYAQPTPVQVIIQSFDAFLCLYNCIIYHNYFNTCLSLFL